MREPSGRTEFVFRNGTQTDAASCVSLWVLACAARDGVAVAGVAERARPKFDRAECWIVAAEPATDILGFVLATKPRSGLPADPTDAPVVGLLAVAPEAQGRGLGGALLTAAAAELARRGHEHAVLHVLAGNSSAIRLYARNGWKPLGEPFPHALLKQPTQTYVLDLGGLDTR